MAQRTEPAPRGPNPKVRSIEHVGDDGFIVEAMDVDDPDFYGGKRLFPNYDELLRFLARYLKVYRSEGNTYGIKREENPEDPLECAGEKRHRRLLVGIPAEQQMASEVG